LLAPPHAITKPHLRKTGLLEIDFEHSSHELNRPEAQCFRVKLANLNIPKIDLVEVFIGLLETEHLKSKDCADEHPAFVPADVAAVVHSPEHKPVRINELDRIARQKHRTWLIYAAWSCIA
jgi:hypothetical protein